MRFRDIPQFTREGNWQCDFSIEDLVAWIDKERKEGLQLTPDFQRGHVWSEEQQIKFLEFFFKGGQSGRILYFNKPDWNTNVADGEYNDYVCVDGLQRITACQRFVNNEIPIFGAYYKDFEDKPQARFTFKVNINDLKSKNEVLQWYLDMNSGTPHSVAELERVSHMLDAHESDLLIAIRCVTIRELRPNQIIKGKIYWYAESSEYTDCDGDTFITVYSDVNGEHEVGVLNKKHFCGYINYPRYCSGFSPYINDTRGLLLIDIISHCKDARGYDQAARNILRYIEDHGYDKPINYFKEYMIISTPYATAEKIGTVDDYVKYTGYSLKCRDDLVETNDTSYTSVFGGK